MAIFEIAKNGFWSKIFRGIDLFEFTSFLVWTFLNFLAHYDINWYLKLFLVQTSDVSSSKTSGSGNKFQVFINGDKLAEAWVQTNFLQLFITTYFHEAFPLWNHMSYSKIFPPGTPLQCFFKN